MTFRFSLKTLISCSLLPAILWVMLPAIAAAYTFKLDSAGYHPQAVKTAIVEDVPAGTDLQFEIYDPDAPGIIPYTKGRVVLKIDQIRKYVDPNLAGPGSERWILDFSSITEPGEYILRIKGQEQGYPFKVSEFLYWDALVPTVRSFYLQRSGQEIDDKQTGLFKALSHAEDGLIVTDDGEIYRKDVSGGWYNSGDYDKQTTPTAIVAAEMLALYEANPKAMNFMKLSYPLTEPGLGDVPDYLHELRYGLDWLLAMQRNDGAFYRKVSGRSYPGVVRPGEDYQQRFIYGITSQDTAAATAALAMASRNYRQKDVGYAVKALLAAERGWRFLDENPEPVMDVSVDDDSGSPEYLNPSAEKAYRFWAATELYLATGKPAYHQYIHEYFKDLMVEPFSWRNPAMMGMMNYILYAPDEVPKVSRYFRTQIVRAADMLLDRIGEGSYNITLKEFTKGSNHQLLEHQAILLNAYRLTRKDKYRRAATESTRYLFGLNPLGKTFVTGVGNNPVQHPTHRLIRVTHKVIPGLLVAGPNHHADDGKTPAGLHALSYIDHSKAADVNRTEIMYNGSLIYVLGMLNAVYNNSQ